MSWRSTKTIADAIWSRSGQDPTKGPRRRSLARLWGAWHAEYLDAETPRLLVRYEDLLFRPQETVAEVCGCVGGRVAKGWDFDPLLSAYARGRGGRNFNLRRYGNDTLRRANINRGDLADIGARLGSLPARLGYAVGKPDR